MKSLDGDLTTLCGELERLDYVVVKHGDFVCVRLPLISSVRVYHTAERGFRFVPQVGPFHRSAGLFLTSVVAVAALAASAFAFGLTPVTLTVGFLGLVALAHDACRFVLTEGCLTRLQQLIASRAVTRSSLAPGQRPALGELSAQYTYLDQRAPDPTSVVR
jgi:hypothetical protein